MIMSNKTSGKFFGGERWSLLGQAVTFLLTVAYDFLLVYGVYFLSRLTFLLVNWSYFSETLSCAHLTEMWVGGMRFDTTAILYTNILWVLLVLLPVRQKERVSYHRFCRGLFVTVNSLSLIVNLCDTIYFPFSLRRTTTAVFDEFSNETNLSKIFLQELSAHWYLLLLAVAVSVALFKLYASPRYSTACDSPNTKESASLPSATDSPSTEGGATLPAASSVAVSGRRYAAVMLLSLLLFLPFCWAGIRGGWTSATRPIANSDANDYCLRPIETALVLNTPFTLLRTIGKNRMTVPHYFADEAEMSAVYDPLHVPRPSSPFRQKNVVVLIVESFAREYIGALNPDLDHGRYRGYTPFTDSLLQHSLTFRYSYCNGRKSIDGMPSILSSVPMFVQNIFTSPYAFNHFSGLADCLNGKGYSTAFFHGAQRGSMGFLSFARATCFQHYYGREDFVADPRTRGDSEYDGWWGISDDPFLQYFCLKLSEMREPFMTALFTLSSHHPFIVPEPYRDVFREEEMPIHKTIRYVDMSLRHFFESAKRQPWYENTLFVITNDHTNETRRPEFLTDIGVFASPIIFFDPSGELEPGMADAIAQQIDIMPTVLSYLNYDKPYVAFGTDLLTTPAEDTWAVNYLNGIYQYAKHGEVLQFDGEKTRAVYSLQDTLMTRNLLGTSVHQPSMERELKALIQQYMWRMTTNHLVP